MSINPIGFDMRNAQTAEDVSVGLWIASARRTWGDMIVSDRQAAMWREEFGPVAAVRYTANVPQPWIRPVTYAEYVRAGILAALWNGQDQNTGAIY